MEKTEFSKIRKRLGKSQRQIAPLMGVALKTIRSYEQGWRPIPAHIERNLLFFLINQRGKPNKFTPCWEEKDCHQKEECPAWEFQSGNLCWYMFGTLCNGTREATYEEKIENCRSCNIFKSLIQ